MDPAEVVIVPHQRVPEASMTIEQQGHRPGYAGAMPLALAHDQLAQPGRAAHHQRGPANRER